MSDSQKQNSPASPNEAPDFSATIPLILLLVSVIGLGVAFELTHIHYQSHTNPKFESICAISEALNCETVARSPYSVFLGLPISVWGIFAYSIFIVLCAYVLKQRRSIAGAFLAASSVALVTSVLLAYISTYIIQSVCLFCSTLYVVNAVLFVSTVVWVRRQRMMPIRLFVNDIKFILARMRFFVPLAINVAILLTVTLLMYPPYWRHSHYRNLPKLPTGVTEAGNHWIGAENPKLTVVEFSDYECPFCRKAHYQTRLMLARYADEVRLVHKHMPMDNKCNEYLEKPFHNRACEFAKVVECAGKQGKFWEMNDALFGIQDTVPAENVDADELASEMGVDVEQMKKCIKSAMVAQRLGAHIDEATDLNIPGTPTYYVGAQPYPGGIPEQTLKKYLKK